MGADFSGVRVHDDAEADGIARSVQATAFTAGADVYFSRGTYAPGTSAGDHLLSHELAHVVQGGRGASAAAGPVIGKADDPAEAAADAMADSAVHRLQRQATRASSEPATAGARAVESTGGTGAAAGTGALRRQAVRAESSTIRRWNPFKKLFGGKKKKPVTVPNAPLLAPSPTGVAPRSTSPVPTSPVPTSQVPQPRVSTEPEPQVTQEQVTNIPETQPHVTGEQTQDTVVEQPEVQPTPKTAKERFEEACDPQTAPPNKTVAKSRMDALRQLISTFSREEKKSIADDGAAMAIGRAHLGDLYYMSLLAAVDMAKKKTKSSGTKVKHHLTGAEADEFITTNIEDYPHIKPFIAAAVSAGKKGEGYVASISPEDWAIVYGVEFPTDSVEEEQSTNAYASTKNKDEPAILHADRGTPSTAIHESMHRYAKDDVLETFGFDLNEGMTEYFTRMLTTKNATPTKDGGPERENYQDNVTFVRGMIRILGANKVDQETVLGEIYFEGKTEKLEEKFRAAWKAKDSTITATKLDTSWASFKKHLSDGKWTKAERLLPAA
ncbi:hypothetical protein GALL_372110 [mine drainage metagenome]|uniref:eCIS core domain-containing protein n=1 Tax=mine drainage metagenome TaxID=410659 RepID=A0A1J5QCV9_9ZZZZ